MAISMNPVFRRIRVGSAVWAVPPIAAVLAAPIAVAAPPDPDPCGDPSELVQECMAPSPEDFSSTSFGTSECMATLPEDFSSTSFSTSSVSGGTNYSILFSTEISSGPPVPAAATGYEIESIRLAGEKRDGTTFSLTPAIGEVGPRVLDTPSASSLGFTLDVPWTPGQLVRSFDYTYEVAYLNGLTEVETRTYVTTMELDDNGQVAGGVGSVTFSAPTLADCLD